MLLSESVEPKRKRRPSLSVLSKKVFTCQDTARCLKQGHYRGKNRGHSLSTWKTKSLFNRSKPFSPDPSSLRYFEKTNSKIESFASICMIPKWNAGMAKHRCPPKNGRPPDNIS